MVEFKAMTSDTFGPLLFTVFTSILEVILLCLAGYILAVKGIIDKRTQKQLNRLNVSLLTPCLLFSKVAFFLSPDKIKELWVLPIFFVVVTVVSMSVAYILGTLFRLKKSQRAFAMAAAMFMNSNSLPVAMMQSLVMTVPGLKYDKTDNKNDMLGRALTYLMLYSTLGMVLRWSYGVRLLSQADEDVVADNEAAEETEPLLEHMDEPQPMNHDIPDITIHPPATNGRPGLPQRQSSRFYNSFPNSPTQSRVQLPTISSGEESSASSTRYSESDDSDLEDLADQPNARMLPSHIPHLEPPPSDPSPSKTRGFFQNAKRWIASTWNMVNDFMTVPLWAALFSVIVACVQPFQHALQNHMQPVKGALNSAGNCSIPFTLLVLGAYFYPAPKEETKDSQLDAAKIKKRQHRSLLKSVKQLFKDGKKRYRKSRQEAAEQRKPGETKTIVIAVVSRMIITPVLLLPLMAVGAKYDVQAVFADPVFVVSTILLLSSPPALTLAQITQAASGDAFERLISGTIFWSYCVVTTPALIIYTFIALWMAGL